ncbi:beta strand repeat-containing protein, partial [Mycobacterium sp. RTGN3]
MAVRPNRQLRSSTSRHRKVAGTCQPQAVFPTFTLTQAPKLGGAGGGYARFVGRVGALAVALGVGAAIASGFGMPVAHADDTGQGSPVNDQPETKPDGKPGSSTTEEPGPVATVTAQTVVSEPKNDPDDPNPAPGPNDPPNTGMNFSSSGGYQKDEHRSADGAETNITTTGADSPIEQTSTDYQIPAGEVERPPAHPVTPSDPVTPTNPELAPAPQPRPSDGHVVPSKKARVTDLSSARQLTIQNSESSSAQTTTLTTFGATQAGGQPSTAPGFASVQNLAAATATPGEQALASLPARSVDVLTTFVAALLSPFLTPGPSTPAPPPMLFAVLAFVRQELGRSFFNRTPNAVDNSATTNEDTSATINVLGNDTDADFDALTVTDFTQPAHGTVVKNSSGTLTYTPDADFNGTDTFSYTVTDDEARPHFHGLGGIYDIGHEDTATVTVTVTPVNDAPVADDEAYTVAEDTLLNIATPGVLAGDTDADGDPLAVTGATDPANGSVTVNPNGSFTYTPDENFNGVDTFDYTVSDGTLTDAGTVTITVTAVPDAPVAGDDSYETEEDTPLTVTAPGVLADDTDGDGDPLSVTGATDPSNGSVTVNPNGSFIYTPDANFNGVDTFDYTVSDGTLTDTGTVTINVTPTNDPPTAVDDGPFAVAEDGSRILTAVELLGNDADPDFPSGDILHVATVTAGPNTHGSVVLNGDGSVTYAPATNYAGPASFTYTAADAANAESGSATVTLNVINSNDAPTAVDDGPFTVAEDGSRILTAAELVGNDTDPDLANTPADVLHVASVAATADTHGSAVLNGDGTVTYTPATNYAGPASFTYTAADAANAESGSATVTLNVVNSNDAPTAVDDGTFDVNEDGSRTFSATQLVGNDTDPDFPSGDILHVATVTAGPNTHGSVVLNGDGSVTYTPATNYAGPASFTYTAADAANAESGSATVTLNVINSNDAPTAVDDGPFTVAEDGSRILTAAELVGNDTDPDLANTPADVLHVASVAATADTHGSAVLNGDGTVTYTPATNYAGPASFTYTAADAANAESGSATVTLNVVNSNDAPTAVDDGTFDVNEDGSRTFSATQLVGNDTDPDLANTPADVLHVASVTAGPDTHGSVVLNGDGTVTYTPATNYAGPASFTYTVADTAGTPSANTATVSLSVINSNDAPTAVDDGTYDVNEDGSRTFSATQLVGNDTDPDLANTPADVLHVASVTAGPDTHGSVVLNGDGTVTYTPATNYAGPASFNYTVADAAGTQSANSAVVSLTVINSNDAPTAVDDGPYAVAEDGSRILTAAELVGNDTDPDFPSGDTLQVASVTAGPNTHGSVVLNGDGTVTYTPATNYAGPASFTYTVADAAGTQSANSAVVSLTVVNSNDAPTAVDDGTFDVNEDGSRTFSATQLVGNDTDPDLANTPADVLHVASVAATADTHGSVVLNGDGTVTYTPATNYAGPASFTYIVADAAGTQSANTALVSLTVVNSNDAPTAVDDGPFDVNEDGSRTFSATQLVGNDTDPDLANPTPDVLHVASVAPTADTHGSVVLNGDGTVTYTPATNYAGPASFTYTVADAAGTQSANTALVSLTVVNSNDAPTAVDDGPFDVNEDGSRTFSATQLVGNDTDPDLANTPADVLHVASVTGGPDTHGSVVLNGDGTVTYTPTTNYAGPASFTYTVADAANAESATTATVTIDVINSNDAPTAVDDGPYDVDEDGSRTFSAAQLVGNDTDPDLANPVPDVLHVASVNTTADTHGTVVLNGDGSVTYTPTTNYAGPATFTYTVADAAGTESATTAVVSLTVVNSNDAPTAVDDGVFDVNEDGSRTFSAAQLVGNDTDPDLANPVPDVLHVASVTAGPDTHGSVVLNGDGTVTYTPTTNYAGPASFTYTVADTAGTESATTALVSLTVTDVEDPVVAIDDTASGAEGTGFGGGNVLTNDRAANVDGADETLTVTTTGVLPTTAGGTVSMNFNGAYIYTPPNANFFGTDTFMYTVSDGTSTDVGLVTITVTDVEDPVAAVNDTAAGNEGTPITGNVLTN